LNKEVDWEFPHIVTDSMEQTIKCNNCEEVGDFIDWQIFIQEHKDCKKRMTELLTIIGLGGCFILIVFGIILVKVFNLG